MKKYLIGSAIALSLVVAGAQSANALTQAEANVIITALSLNAAQAAAIQSLVTAPAVTPASSFTRDLTIGSTGSDVVALQTWLESNGYLTMPAGVAKGYFGTLTKNAVAAYQTAKGISPAAGYFGRITRESLSAGSPVVTNPGTPVVTNPGTGSTVISDGTDGSATISLSSYAGNTTIKKGETKDLVAAKLQATAGTVTVSRFDVRFNKRPWLYFSQLKLKDSNGNVLATKSLGSASDATEITVASDYLVRFENVNANVVPGSDRTFVVEGTVYASSDKITEADTIIVSIPTGSVRTINGKGYTDSLGLGTVAVSGTSGRTVTFTTSGSTANIVGRISPSSPAARIVTTSTSGQTNDVILGQFDFKSENQTSTLNSLNFSLNTTGGQRVWTSVLKNLRLTDGTNTYNVDNIAGSTGLASSTNTFSNLNIQLPLDTWKTLTVKADVADQDDFVNGMQASTSITINTTNVIGTDVNYNTVTASGANTVASNDITFLSAGVSVSNTSASVGNALYSPTVANLVIGNEVTFTFTLNNTSNNAVYVSKTVGTAIGTTSADSTDGLTTTSASTTLTVLGGGSAQNGDTAASFIINAGASRTFTATGFIKQNGSTGGTRVFAVNTLYFGDDATNTREFSITFGLDNLRATRSF